MAVQKQLGVIGFLAVSTLFGQAATADAVAPPPAVRASSPSPQFVAASSSTPETAPLAADETAFAWWWLLLPSAVGGGLWLRTWQRKKREQQAAERAAQEAEDAATAERRARERAEKQRIERLLADSSPIISGDVVQDFVDSVSEFETQQAQLFQRFATINTFDAASAWDEEANGLRERALDTCENVRAFCTAAQAAIASYRGTTADDSGLANARVKHETGKLTALAKLPDMLVELAMELDERIDATPNSKKAASATVRELRTTKKELQAQKKEARARMSTIRSIAKQAAEETRPSAWAGSYTKRTAADERRTIRRQKDAALRPHESEIAALDRQILDVDRRIAWVQRFGDAPDD